MNELNIRSAALEPSTFDAENRTVSVVFASNAPVRLRGDVFTEELIETYIDYKRRNEAEAVRLRPHPYEFALYYDV
jgi:glutamine synthetase